jgi:ketosteroid isomerase-like protein
MSTENVELIRSILPEEIDLVQAITSDDPVGVIFRNTDAVAPNLEVKFASTQSGALPTDYRGLDGLTEGWRDWLEPWDSYRIRFNEFIDARDKVLVFADVHARTSRHGVEVEHNPAAVWTIRDGMLIAVTFFLERDQALKFAGIDWPEHNLG